MRLCDNFAWVSPIYMGLNDTADVCFLKTPPLKNTLCLMMDFPYELIIFAKQSSEPHHYHNYVKDTMELHTLHLTYRLAEGRTLT